MSSLEMNGNNIKSAFELLDYSTEGYVDIPKVIENLSKMGYDKTHPELFDLFNSLGDEKIEYNDFMETITNIMNQKEEDAGLQRMYDLLLFNPTLQAIDFDTLKQIAEETGHHMTDSEIKLALKEAGDGKTIPIDAFIKFMKS